MKKVLFSLLLGFSSVCHSNSHDVSRLGEMSMYQAFVDNNIFELVLQEIETHKGKMRSEVRKKLLESGEGVLEQARMMCLEQEEKCHSLKLKDFERKNGENFLNGLMQRMSMGIEEMENTAKKEGYDLWIKSYAIQDYQNMTLVQLAQLPQENMQAVHQFLKGEVGVFAASEIMQVITGAGLSCNDANLQTMFGKKKAAEAREQLKCDVKLQDFLDDL